MHLSIACFGYVRQYTRVRLYILPFESIFLDYQRTIQWRLGGNLRTDF